MERSVPTIKVFGHCKICIYAADHNPPLFYVLAPKFAVKVEIASLRIMAGTARRKNIREALEWAKANRAILSRRWTELNETD